MLSIQGRRKLFVKNLREQVYVTDNPYQNICQIIQRFLKCTLLLEILKGGHTSAQNLTRPGI